MEYDKKEEEYISLKDALHRACKIGQENGEKLTEYFFRLRINWAFKDLKATNFYQSLSEQDKRYIDECESYLRRGTY